MARRIWENLGTFILAFFLALLVWIVALNEENPIEERTLPQSVPIEIVNQPEDMIIVGSPVTRTQVTIRAPRLVLDRLSARQIQVIADLSQANSGTNVIPLVPRLSADSARIVSLDPDAITVTLEQQAQREVPVEVQQSGTPAAGYEAEPPILSADAVSISGPASEVASVSKAVVRYALDDLRRDFNSSLTVIPVDSAGEEVTGVTVSPSSIQVRVPITQKVGFREVAVKVVFTGQVASGYQLTNITVVPNNVTVTSADPRLVEQMPGFVNTHPLDISGASDDIVRLLPLDLPPGVSVASDDPTVLVQANIAAIEYSVTLERGLEVRGLAPGLAASTSPETVEVFILGPLPVLDGLALQDVRVVVDLTGLGPGTYQVVPEVELLLDSLRAENVLPNRVEVVITEATPTPTEDDSTPEADVTETPPAIGTVTPTPTRTRTPAPTATPTPSPTPGS